MAHSSPTSLQINVHNFLKENTLKLSRRCLPVSTIISNPGPTANFARVKYHTSNKLIDCNLSICLWLTSHCSTLVAFSVSSSYTQSVGVLGRGSARCKATTCIQDSTNTLNAHRHQCLKWDLNQRSQCLTGRRQFMP
jgi:hypothetical protein